MNQPNPPPTEEVKNETPGPRYTSPAQPRIPANNIDPQAAIVFSVVHVGVTGDLGDDDEGSTQLKWRMDSGVEMNFVLDPNRGDRGDVGTSSNRILKKKYFMVQANKLRV